MYRPLGLQKVQVFRISRQSAHKNGKIAFTLQEISLVLISLKHWVDPKRRMLLEGLSQLTPSRIEPATFRLVAQCLNQLRNRHSSWFILDRALWNTWYKYSLWNTWYKYSLWNTWYKYSLWNTCYKYSLWNTWYKYSLWNTWYKYSLWNTWFISTVYEIRDISTVYEIRDISTIYEIRDISRVFDMDKTVSLRSRCKVWAKGDQSVKLNITST